MTIKTKDGNISVSDHIEENERKSKDVFKPEEIIPTRVVENSDEQDALIGQASAWLGRPREGIHVSDLDFMRWAYWQKKHPEVKPTERETGYYLAGRGHHGIIQYITTHPNYQEVSVDYEGVHGHIDMLHVVPVELKTTRMQKVRTAEELQKEQPHYFSRLGFYCAMTDSSEGRLILFYLFARTDNGMRPLIEVYDVHYDNLDSIKKEIVRRKEALKSALEKEDPSLLPGCPDWMCKNCRFKKLCKE